MRLVQRAATARTDFGRTLLHDVVERINIILADFVHYFGLFTADPDAFVGQ